MNCAQSNILPYSMTQQRVVNLTIKYLTDNLGLHRDDAHAHAIFLWRIARHAETYCNGECEPTYVPTKTR